MYTILKLKLDISPAVHMKIRVKFFNHDTYSTNKHVWYKLVWQDIYIYHLILCHNFVTKETCFFFNDTIFQDQEVRGGEKDEMYLKQ